MRNPLLYRAQDAWKPSLCWASCSLFLAAKTVTCQEQQICPSCILSLASSRAHTGRIRTCRTEGRGSCLLDRSAVQSVATDHSSPMGSSMNDPAGTLSFPEPHRFWKEIYDYRCSEGRNSLCEIFSFNDFLVLFSPNRRTPLHFLKYPICKNVERMISCGVFWCSIHYWLLKFVIYSPCFSSLQEREMVTQEKQFIEVFLCKWISIMCHKMVAVALVAFWSISPQKELGINLGVKSHRILTVFMEHVKLLSS